MARIFVPLLVVVGLVGTFVGIPVRAAAQDKVKSHFVIEVPDGPPHGYKETILTVGGLATEQTGPTRKFVTPDLDKGATYTYEIKAVIEPNNYTTISRTKKVKFKGGEPVKVDMTMKLGDEKIVVRWVPTPTEIIDKMCEMAKVTKNDTVYDLGCGKGEMLIEAVKQFKAKRGVGVDIDPKILDDAKKNVKAAGLSDKIDLKLGDMLKTTEKDVADADVVLLYIGDDLGERLSPVLRKALKPGARVVSHRFTLGDWTPTTELDVRDHEGTQYHLLLWVIPEKK
ncbi:MAG TPA: tRNA (adenine(22)-N(1))-methyltransferase TrmK [Gemmataceae bacterium]|jgi:uncharacterized protein (TIGR03000 family)|nr:tRNA (adenine(22)-N(1))-methyltransferase TrmK [Gemmataceae bacterium]